MKHFILILWVTLSFLVTKGQEIVGGEYFFDNYLKQGSGTPFNNPVPSDNSIFSFDIDVSSLSAGLHTLYARTVDSNGQWSHTSKRLFYVPFEEIINDIVGYEYSINNYTKQGEGTFIPVGSPAPFEIDVSTLEPGLHTLFVRTKNSAGLWSMTSKRLFLVAEEYSVPEIISLEYYYESQDFVSEVFEYTDFTPTIDLELDEAIFLANTAGLEYGKTYNLHVRAICDNGIVSAIYNTSFEYKELNTSVLLGGLDAVSVYPNPSDGLFRLSTNKNGNGYYYIFNAKGSLVKKGADLGSWIDMSNYPAGIYVMKIKIEDKIYSSRIVIE
jgi:hypothetical protein